jgi:putative transposase
MVTKALCKSWKSFLVSVKDYTIHPEKYLGKPKIPAYKKKDGRFVCTLTNMQTKVKDGYLYFAFK